ncbi:DUF2335 domain-containing protein [Levilactobacillus parabrevis]|uniref:DUF2335 domain-containing protein n=1 Tax=Levilactobacillus parabrevis TaxID=357278 RepID=UPI0037572CE4
MTESLPGKQSKISDKNNVGSRTDILDKLENLPSEDQEKIIATMEMYSGPIPHPAILEGYEKLYPGAAKEIIENGVQESQHRRKLETKRQARWGRLAWFTLGSLVLVTILLLVGSFVLIMNNHRIIGTVFGAGGFLVFLGSLVDQVNALSGKDDISTDKNDEDN